MLFRSVVAAFCVISSAIALPIVSPRDVTVPDQAMKRIVNRLRPLDDAMKRIRTGVGDPNAQTMNLLALDWDVQHEFRESAKLVRKIPDLSTMEATSLLTAMNQLPSMTTSVAGGWIQWKPMIAAAQKEREVLRQLRDDADALNEFADALNGKAPKVAMIQTVGSTWKSALSASYDKAVKEYERR
jgi:hypothetical protein